jgi:hypothetical protein
MVSARRYCWVGGEVSVGWCFGEIWEMGEDGVEGFELTRTLRAATMVRGLGDMVC